MRDQRGRPSTCRITFDSRSRLDVVGRTRIGLAQPPQQCRVTVVDGGIRHASHLTQLQQRARRSTFQRFPVRSRPVWRTTMGISAGTLEHGGRARSDDEMWLPHVSGHPRQAETCRAGAPSTHRVARVDRSRCARCCGAAHPAHTPLIMATPDRETESLAATRLLPEYGVSSSERVSRGRPARRIGPQAQACIGGNRAKRSTPPTQHQRVIGDQMRAGLAKSRCQRRLSCTARTQQPRDQ